MTRICSYLKNNALAAVALFVALGGTSYAAVSLPANAVGTRQLKNGAVTGRKLAAGSVSARQLNTRSVAGYVRDWAKIAQGGIITASRPKARLVNWSDAPGDPFPGGIITWHQAIPQSCFAEATTAFASQRVSYVSAAVLTASRNVNKDGAQIELSSDTTPVNVAIICP